MIKDKTFLIFGGTGSLGYELNKKYLDNNKIYNFSRDENKHWKMNIDLNYHKNLLLDKLKFSKSNNSISNFKFYITIFTSIYFISRH